MSPTTAKLDSEKQVVELLFEGLLEEVPDESGAVRYRPGASFDPPLAFPGGREFLLRTFPQDPQGRPGFESRDVLETITYLRSRPELWVSYPMGWFAPDQPPLRDSQSIRIAFGVAHPDPRSLLTFKILPMRYLQSNSWTPDDPRFAEKPFGTGPFRLHSNPKSDGKGSAREMVFVNNPTYGRADRAGLPFLREVRFVEANKVDTVKAFLEGKLHLLPDVPTAEIDRYQDAASGLKGKVDVVTAKVNRRVHILAVNLRRPYLQNKNLRQGLSYAINRDEILRKEFRANKVDVHKAMTGPFPPGSWATSRGPGGESPLFSKDLALVRLKAYLAADPNAETTIKLAYSQNDPSADKACQEIKKQIEDLFKADAGGGKKLTIQLEKMPIERLLSAVQEQHASFDLAYVPFDYPDDWYPLALGAALDPEASKQRNGRNWFGFRDDTTNPDAADQQLGRDLAKLRGYRDFSGELVPQAIAVTKQFNESLPFIPLWQLDRHMVVSRKLKISLDETSATGGADLLNQTTLFQGVGRWRVD
jgi:ABC-type oligopeptide transport system substrate-binding subunit